MSLSDKYQSQAAATGRMGGCMNMIRAPWGHFCCCAAVNCTARERPKPRPPTSTLGATGVEQCRVPEHKQRRGIGAKQVCRVRNAQTGLRIPALAHMSHTQYSMGINGKLAALERALPRMGAPLWALLEGTHLGAELHPERDGHVRVVSMAICGWRAASCKVGECRWRLCSHSRIAGQDWFDARHQKAAICCRGPNAGANFSGRVVLMMQVE
jgi:hypothetical protein